MEGRIKKIAVFLNRVGLPVNLIDGSKIFHEMFKSMFKFIFINPVMGHSNFMKIKAVIIRISFRISQMCSCKSLEHNLKVTRSMFFNVTCL